MQGEAERQAEIVYMRHEDMFISNQLHMHVHSQTWFRSEKPRGCLLCVCVMELI